MHEATEMKGVPGGDASAVFVVGHVEDTEGKVLNVSTARLVTPDCVIILEISLCLEGTEQAKARQVRFELEMVNTRLIRQKQMDLRKRSSSSGGKKVCTFSRVSIRAKRKGRLSLPALVATPCFAAK